MVPCLECGNPNVFVFVSASIPVCMDPDNDGQVIWDWDNAETSDDYSKYECDHCGHMYDKGTMADDFSGVIES